MASHVLLVDSRARQTRIPTTPATYLSDVLQQGCQKLGLDATLFVLKYNNKIVDLSRPIRQAGLPSGAQLQLVQGSRSPTVINVAVQIPHMDSTRRITEKVPSSHSIWQILRLLETKEKLNFTQRAEGKFDLSNAGAGSGRMCYEMPVVDFLNRSLNTFPDLQKTLSQLGITSGNVSMRLSFKLTEQPLEEAMSEITQYFNETFQESSNVEKAEASDPSRTPVIDKNDTSVHEQPLPTAGHSLMAAPLQDVTAAQDDATLSTASPSQAETTKPGITVYSAPTTNVTARTTYNEADYVPTTEHAAVHQARLQQSSRNTKLLSDAELAARAKEHDAKLAAITSVGVRIRLPDLTQIQSDFARGATAHDVYATVRSQMRSPLLRFALRYVDARGAHVLLPDDPAMDIITGAGWRGRVLANMEWDAAVSAEQRRQPVLTAEALGLARELPVPSAHEDERAGEKKGGFLGGLLKKDGAAKSEMSGAEKEDKLKKFLRFGKK